MVAIGLLVAKLQRTEKGFASNVVKSGSITGPEDEIIPKFWRFFDRCEPLLVTWNGRGYDLPVLRTRALIKGIPMSRWFKFGNRYENYSYRYSANWHCDLMDQISDYGACSKPAMDLIAKAMGLPGKLGGNGAQVQAMFEAGEIENVAAYCECDVLNLYGIYLRWLLVTGQMDRSGYECSQAQLANFLGTTDKAHHAEFLAKWDRGPSVPYLTAAPCHNGAFEARH